MLRQMIAQQFAGNGSIPRQSRARARGPGPWLCVGVLALAPAIACSSGGGSESAPSEDGWQVERSVDGNVTTVRNLAGSKWGADATLELLREIGVEEGDESYMLARPAAFWATEDEIFVLDAGISLVRVYGRDDGVYRATSVGRARGRASSNGRVRWLWTPTAGSWWAASGAAASSSASSSPRGSFWRTGRSSRALETGRIPSAPRRTDFGSPGAGSSSRCSARRGKRCSSVGGIPSVFSAPAPRGWRARHGLRRR